MRFQRGMTTLLLVAACNAPWQPSIVDAAIDDAGSVDGQAGGRWRSIKSGTQQELRGLWGSGSSWIAVGDQGTALTSSDNGLSWTAMSGLTTGANLESTWGLASGERLIAGDHVLFRRRANSTQWEASASPPSQTLHAIWGWDGGGTSHVFVAGDYGSILLSTDRGSTWQPLINNATLSNLFGIWGCDDAELWAVGAFGTIIHSTDWGQTWTTQVSPTQVALHAAWGACPQNVTLAGGEGTVLRTTDRGMTWSADPSGITQDLLDFWAAATGEAFAVGTAGTIVRRLPGQTWHVEASNTASRLNAVWGDAANGTVIAVGANGMILRRE